MLELGKRSSEIFQPSSIHEFELTVRTQRKYEAGDVVDNELKTSFVGLHGSVRVVLAGVLTGGERGVERRVHRARQNVSRIDTKAGSWQVNRPMPECAREPHALHVGVMYFALTGDSRRAWNTVLVGESNLTGV
jgi:hypothetical protein